MANIHLLVGDRRRNSPATASTIPNSRGQDTGSLKNAIPAIAISAAPPASTMGTAEAALPSETAKERNRSRTNADPGENRIKDTRRRRCLVPLPRKP